MKRMLPIALSALLAAGHAHAGGLDVCNVESDYDLTIGRSALTFTRADGTPSRIEMRNGQLVVDGQVQSLSAADRARIATYEDTVRDLIPEVKAIALDAVGIATDAVLQVAAAFAGGKEPRSLDKIEAIGTRLSARIEASNTTTEWRNDEFDAAVEALTAELVPMIVGDIASLAVSAALSGDTSKVAEIEARADALEREIESRVEARADGLEARAKQLCPRIHALDTLESELELRLADGSALDLMQASTH